MVVSERTTAAYRSDVRAQGRELTAAEREKLLRPYLPAPQEPSRAVDSVPKSNGTKARRKPRRKPVRTFVKSQLHVLLYYLIHLVFGIYIRLRQIYHATVDRLLAIAYYHHRTPALIRKDVRNLSRLPEHLSVILTLKGEEDGGLEALMDEVAELCAWCASAGIPLLSVYEKSGMGKPVGPVPNRANGL
jgi:dehydrodolichyl diphosphate syntase complex subunit NUS1